jgi:hypothetical protein
MSAPSSNSGLVVVDNFDLPGIAISPFKTDSPLVIDTDAPLAFAVAFQRFQPVSRRGAKLFNLNYPVDLAQFPKSNSLKSRILPAMAMLKNLLGFLVGEGADHL